MKKILPIKQLQIFQYDYNFQDSQTSTVTVSILPFGSQTSSRSETEQKEHDRNDSIEWKWFSTCEKKVNTVFSKVDTNHHLSPSSTSPVTR